MSLNLEKQLCFYGAYHHNPTNIGIHMTCVPLILATSLLLATNTPAAPLPEWLSIPNLPLNFGTVAAIFYSGFYILLEPVAGSILLPVIIGWTAFANHLTSTASSTLANQASIAVFVVSWIAQFVGHGVYEGRAPALLDNLVQALVLAPFFVFMEALFKFGYRPELQKRVGEGVEKEIKKFRAEKAQNGNGSAKNGKAH